MQAAQRTTNPASRALAEAKAAANGAGATFSAAAQRTAMVTQVVKENMVAPILALRRYRMGPI
jgi:hypothetical protein